MKRLIIGMFPLLVVIVVPGMLESGFKLAGTMLDGFWLMFAIANMFYFFQFAFFSAGFSPMLCSHLAMALDRNKLATATKLR